MPTLTSDMMRQIIMDHYSNPLNKHLPTSDKFIKVHMHSDNCIDDLDIYLLLDNNKVIERLFNRSVRSIDINVAFIFRYQINEPD